MPTPIKIKDYAEQIRLFEPYIAALVFDNKATLVDELLMELCEENNSLKDYNSKRRLLHAKLNTLAPNTLNNDSIDKLNQLLQSELEERTITDAKKYSSESKLAIGNTKLVLWQGDISTLKIDAIVNAANNQLLGCFHPLHACIDNVIHSAAGVQLRDDCNVIMQKQGFNEPTGAAKITRGYNLPAKFVMHTVGPIVQNEVTALNKTDLANAYTSCLEIGKEVNRVKSIAFCGISTGVFGYPAKAAAELAFDTVINWLKNNPAHLDLVVFNVFSDNDRMIYERLIERL